jgi:Tfp pilus assembly protein PilV
MRSSTARPPATAAPARATLLGTPVLHREDGLALPLAMIVILILSALMLGLAETTTSELSLALPAHRDLRATYLAQAALEHQIYLLKANKGAAAMALTNYPVTTGQEAWYSTTLTCLLNCAANFETRTWQIVATGEIHQTGGPAVLQTRAIRAVVEIHYGGNGAPPFQQPTKVFIVRWEEVYP